VASLSIPYTRGTVPTILLRLETANGRKIVGGEIDSGSDRSLCPLSITGDLGLSPAELAKDANRGMPAVGDTFDTWSPVGIAITGQIVLPPDENGDFVPWGPIFPMAPAFAETNSLLLGQRDFFAAFDLRFLNQSDGPVFEICEYAHSPKGP